jgi:ABC-2 type transport system ATP-binding protein
MQIQAKNLVKRYGDKVAVSGIDLEITPGKILGLLGPNGAGKSTTIGMLTGQRNPTEGEIIINGESYSSVPRKFQKKIGVMPQEVIIWDDLNIKENLEYTATLQGMRGKDSKKRVDYLIEALDMGREVKTLARDLSGGYKRRLNLAISIIHDPEMVFLDEPTPGIDAHSRRFLMDFIAEMGASKDRSVVLTDHYLDEAEKLSDYVVIIDRGQVIAEGTVPELKKRYGSGNLLYVYLDEELLADEQQSEQLEKELSRELGDVSRSKQSLTTLVEDPVKSIQTTIATLDKLKIEALNISVKEPTLEDIFLILTGRAVRE